ncbi:uncharacterized protein LOC117115234 isoform X2 [Anneissia japonica]|uniref:uncharacterized protein LOC117115234 isoform X2 n=1 Tax=Anneissia japonica TaxID=1529436 RepID=UPI0014256BD4|nr:uncharacterized protein LOC117115234 isoform X2 [Anneissia japonica]
MLNFDSAINGQVPNFDVISVSSGYEVFRRNSQTMVAVWVPGQMLFPVPCSSSHEVIPKQRIRIVHGKGYYLVPRKPLISVKQLFLDYLPLHEADYAQLEVFDHTSSNVELHTQVGNRIYFEISNGGKDPSLPLW